MVFPYMDHDLCGLLANSDFKLNHSVAKLLMKQILQGMDYIHAVCPHLSATAFAHPTMFGANDRTTSFIEISRLPISSWAVEGRLKLPISVWQGHGHLTN
jgi:serine/threonine protein kinase